MPQVTINLPDIKRKTLLILLAIAGGDLAAETGWVQTHIAPLVLRHPHLEHLVGGVMLILTLLHNPSIQTALKAESGEK